MKSAITFLLVLMVLNINAQYISNTTFPDTSRPLISDTLLSQIKYANTITAAELKTHLDIIASDDYEGRETGYEGNNKAADYISRYFSELGINPAKSTSNYRQNVAFTFTRWNDVALSVNENKYKHLWDFISFPNNNVNMPAFTSDEVMFMGYGIEASNYSDYKGKNVAGKVIMIYRGDPKDLDGNSRITGNPTESDWDVDKKLKLAKDKGAKLVLIIEADIKKFLEQNRRFLLGGSVQLGDRSKEVLPTANHIYISTTVAKDIMGSRYKKFIRFRDLITKKGKSKKLILKEDVFIDMDKKQTVIESQNMMAFIEGTDKKEELVVVSAHYDHVGKKGSTVFNGADDNGSGTVTLLELAEAYHQAKQDGIENRRSVLFLLVTGEEKGLLGSQYYAENPIYELENTVANVNIDMVGRIDTEHDHDNYIYVIGSDRLSSDLHRINEDVNQKYTQMELDYTYNSENDPNRYYYRSDHYNFAKNGIPAIFFFSGVHEDYHQPSDTTDKILFSKVERTAKHIFHLIWELANREERIVVDGEIK